MSLWKDCIFAWTPRCSSFGSFSSSNVLFCNLSCAADILVALSSGVSEAIRCFCKSDMCCSRDALSSSVSAAICCCCKSDKCCSRDVLLSGVSSAVRCCCKSDMCRSRDVLSSAVSVCCCCMSDMRCSRDALSSGVSFAVRCCCRSDMCCSRDVLSSCVSAAIRCCCKSDISCSRDVLSSSVSILNVKIVSLPVSSLCLFWKFVETLSSVTRRFVDDCCSILSFSALLALSAAFLLSHLCRFSLSVSEARLALDLSFFLLLFSSLTVVPS